MLWIDKHCPRRLDDLIIHKNLTEAFKNLAQADGSKRDLPHLIFYGPSGSGKKTRINALLRSIFGPSIDNIKIENFNRKEYNTDLTVCQSPYHMQIPCSELGSKDKIVVQQLIKDLSSTASAASIFTKAPPYRVFVFTDAEMLSDLSQAGLRRTVEKYIKNARIILHTQQLSSIMDPLRSRCLCVRVPLPSIEEVINVLRRICDAEDISASQASDALLKSIAIHSERNLRRAILILETVATQQFCLTNNILNLPWEDQLNKIVEKILKHQTPKVVGECRDIVYDLISCCIPGDIILCYLTRKLLDNSGVKQGVHHLIIQAAAHFSYTMKRGTKEVWHIEAFLAHVMSAIKRNESNI